MVYICFVKLISKDFMLLLSFDKTFEIVFYQLFDASVWQ